MQNQQIVFVEKNNAQLLDVPMPEVGPKDVLVRLALSTISSGTERANLTGDLNVSIFETFTKAVFPRYCGYSSAGVVEAVGTEVTAVKPGDRVAVSAGLHRRYHLSNEANVHPLDPAVSFSVGALGYISTFPMAAIRKCRLELGESAMVMGLGILGLIALELLHAAGAVAVIGVDPDPGKRELALKHGADYALDPFAPDFAETAKRLTGGGVKVGIEVTGNGPALDGMLDCMAEMGRIALLGCTRNSHFEIDYYHKVHGRGISLIGAHTNMRPKVESSAGLWTHHDDLMTTMRLQAAGRIHLETLVEEFHAPEEAHEVFTRLATDRVFPVVQFVWDEGLKDR